MANVLVVSAHLPYPPRWGFGTRVYQLMRQISSRHDATLLCYAAPGDENVERLRQEFPVEVVHREKQGVAGKRASQLRSLASRVPYDVWTTHSREMQRVIDRLCAEKSFDIVQLESTLLALFEFPPEARIVIDEHNVDYEVYARMHETERSPLQRRRGVDATGEVPDVRPYLQGAEVVVVPIRMGSGTRLKVVEGLAMGRPVVSTTLGCEGVNVRDGEHLLIGDTAAAFAMQIVHLFEHPEVGEALGRAGRQLTEREYSWDYAGERLEQVYQQLSLPRSEPRDRVTT